MEGRLRQWTIDVIGQEEYDRLTLAYPNNSVANAFESITTIDNEYVFKNDLRRLFFRVATCRVYFGLDIKNHPYIIIGLLYDKNCVQNLQDYTTQVLAKRGISNTLLDDKSLDGYFVQCLISPSCTLEFGYRKSFIHRNTLIVNVIHPKQVLEKIDKELNFRLYQILPYKKRRKHCRESVIYFMTAFRRVFPRDICTMIGKMVYETSKNDYCWEY